MRSESVIPKRMSAKILISVVNDFCLSFAFVSPSINRLLYRSIKFGKRFKKVLSKSENIDFRSAINSLSFNDNRKS